MAKAVLSPLTEKPTAQLSPTLFRKQILPKGTINYKGKQLVFDDAYLTELATAFQQGAYDEVAFQFADGANTHTLDPEKRKGTVKGVELADDGLYGTFELEPEAAAYVSKYPNFGVSARIVHDLSKADGTKHKRALMHVLGTLDPRVTGMKPWQPIELSNDDVDGVIDLSDTDWEVEIVTPPVQTAPEDDEQLIAELAKLFETDNGKGEEDDVTLTNQQDVQKQIDLAVAKERKRINALEVELATNAFEREAAALIDAGVPPALVELARPILSTPGENVIELSNGTKTDVRDTFRKMLEECKGYVDLAVERGHTFAGGEDQTDAIVAAWEAMD